MNTRILRPLPSVALTLLLLPAASGQVNFSGLPHSPVGNASLSLAPEGSLTVSNIGSSGEDGVFIDSSGADGAALRLGEPDNFGEIGDAVAFNPLATGGPGVTPPPSVTLTKTGDLRYAVSIDPNAAGQGGGTVGDGGDVFIDFLNADGVVVSSLPVNANGPVGSFDFNNRGPASLFTTSCRGVLKTYFETGDIPSPGVFNPGGGGNPVDGVLGFQIRYPAAELDGVQTLYTDNSGSPGTRSPDRSFAQKLGGFATGVDGGVVVTGLGDAEITSGEQLVISNLGSSGQDGVSIYLGEPDLSGGQPRGARVDRFQTRQEYGQTQQQQRTVVVSGNPVYEESGAVGSNVLYTGSIAGDGAGGLDAFIEAKGLGTDTFELRLSQSGNPLVNEVVIGASLVEPIVSFTGADDLGELTTSLGNANNELRWEFTRSPASATTALGTLVQLDPFASLQLELRALGVTTPAAGIGRVDMLYANTPSVAITEIAIPEPGTLWLAAVGGVMLRSRRRQ